MRILLDSREPPYLANQIAVHPQLGRPKVQMLPTGDIWIDDLIVERKEPGDLLASIRDRRLFNQCYEMRQQTDRAVLLITGQILADLDGNIPGTRWKWNAIDGALFKVQELGVLVCWCYRENEFTNKLAWLVNRDWSERTYISPRKTGIPLSRQAAILDALPEVTPELAVSLLKEYGSPMATIEAILRGEAMSLWQQKVIRGALYNAPRIVEIKTDDNIPSIEK